MIKIEHIPSIKDSLRNLLHMSNFHPMIGMEGRCNPYTKLLGNLCEEIKDRFSNLTRPKPFLSCLNSCTHCITHYYTEGVIKTIFVQIVST